MDNMIISEELQKNIGKNNSKLPGNSGQRNKNQQDNIKGGIVKSLTSFFNDGYLKSKADHHDTNINQMIQHLKQAPESRLKSDLTEILHYIKKIKFFENYHIKENDMLEICELITYEFYE